MSTLEVIVLFAAMAAFYAVGRKHAADDARDKAELVRMDTFARETELLKCIRWYAEGHHFNLPEWEAPESDSWLCPPELVAEMPWMVEDGGVARCVLKGGKMFPAGADEDVICAIAKESP